MRAQEKDGASGMDYLLSMPRRWVTMYIPIGIFVFVLLDRKSTRLNSSHRH